MFYFRDAPTLARELVTGTAPAIAYLFLGIFALTTYLLGGIAREQVCIYMCPWPRIQGAMTDQHTLLVSYRAERGEPRGPARKGADGTVDWRRAATASTARPASPSARPASTSATARSSSASSARCASMPATRSWTRSAGRAGSIAYDTVAKQEAKAARRSTSRCGSSGRARCSMPACSRWSARSCWSAWLNRTVLEVNVLHDRNPPFVLLSDGSIRNGYTVKILNKLHEPREFALAVRGPAEAHADDRRRGASEAAPRSSVADRRPARDRACS